MGLQVLTALSLPEALPALEGGMATEIVGLSSVLATSGAADSGALPVHAGAPSLLSAAACPLLAWTMRSSKQSAECRVTCW